VASRSIQAVGLHDVPEKIAIDKSGFNKAAIFSSQVNSGIAITLRQSKYLDNIVEHDHRAIKRVPRPTLGFKTFHCAQIIIAGIETMHMIRKNQLGDIKDQASSAANLFYSLARRSKRHAATRLASLRYRYTTHSFACRHSDPIAAVRFGLIERPIGAA
jgi:hypothetical protein